MFAGKVTRVARNGERKMRDRGMVVLPSWAAFLARREKSVRAPLEMGYVDPETGMRCVKRLAGNARAPEVAWALGELVFTACRRADSPVRCDEERGEVAVMAFFDYAGQPSMKVQPTIVRALRHALATDAAMRRAMPDNAPANGTKRRLRVLLVSVDSTIREHQMRNELKAPKYRGIMDRLYAVEYWTLDQMLYTAVDHHLVPPHRLLRPNYDANDKSELEKLAKRTTKHYAMLLPYILTIDPLVRHYALEPGDIVRFTRTEPHSGPYGFYRTVFRATTSRGGGGRDGPAAPADIHERLEASFAPQARSTPP